MYNNNTMSDNERIFRHTHVSTIPVKRVNISPRYLSVGPFIIRLYFAKLVAVSKIKCMQMSMWMYKVLSDVLWLSRIVYVSINKDRKMVLEGNGWLIDNY